MGNCQDLIRKFRGRRIDYSVRRHECGILLASDNDVGL